MAKLCDAQKPWAPSLRRASWTHPSATTEYAASGSASAPAKNGLESKSKSQGSGAGCQGLDPGEWKPSIFLSPSPTPSLLLLKPPTPSEQVSAGATPDDRPRQTARGRQETGDLIRQRGGCWEPRGSRIASRSRIAGSSTAPRDWRGPAAHGEGWHAWKGAPA
ncbi:hypothetical protein CDD83_2246 [Cordyceps sp. RAO-2017]|nr:hypothetical protein CDD83_2246 [Cordyceps sp. RAO-2017]